jgi:hypothetical protein
MASAVLFVELAAGRLRKLDRMAWPFAQGSVENRHHATLISSRDLKLGNWRRVAGERLGPTLDWEWLQCVIIAFTMSPPDPQG